MNRKVILVGPSGSLLKMKLGEYIDTFDVVCRLNSSGSPNCLTGEYKDIIGTKTNIWLCRHWATMLANMKNNSYEQLVAFYPNFYEYPPLDNLNIMNNPMFLLAIELGTPAVNECVSELSKFAKKNNLEMKRPTCGKFAKIYLLSKYDKISIIGFDGFKSGHWYGNRFVKQQDLTDKLAVNGQGAHNMELESEYIKLLINKGKIIKENK